MHLSWLVILLFGLELRGLINISRKLNRRDEGLKRSGEPLDYLLILLLLKRKDLMNEARRVYYNQFIEDNSTDQRRLFMASKSLLNMQPDRSLLPHIDVSLFANDMGEFFITKIANIRPKLDGLIRYLNLAILYCLIFNVKRLKQYVIWSHQGRKNLVSWIQYQWLCYLHALTHSFL